MKIEFTIEVTDKYETISKGSISIDGPTMTPDKVAEMAADLTSQIVDEANQKFDKKNKPAPAPVVPTLSDTF